LLPHLALLLVQVCFGAFPLLGKWAFQGFAPTAVAAWRIVVGAAFLLGMAIGMARARAWPGFRDLLRLQALALLGIALNQVLYLEGLRRSSVINAGLLMVTIPVFTFAIAVAVKHERFTWRRGIGIAVATAGALLLVLPRAERANLVGNLLMLANAFCYSLYLVFSRPVLRRHPPIVVTGWVFALSVWTVPLFLDASLLPASPPPRAVLALLLILAFPTIVAYLLNLWALARLRASTIAAYIYLQPLLSVGLGIWQLGERPTESTALAGASILVGLGLVIWR
jgi:drug/metabolite transporter (DMT)-like permease